MSLSFFDVNGRIGFPSKGNPEFPTAETLLDHLDSLGVSRSLTWHIGARDVNASWGNEELLQEIREAPRAHGRIIPALVLSPALFHERDGIERLRESLTNKEAKALRCFPAHLNHTLSHLESAINAVSEFHPVLLFDCRSLPAQDSLSSIASRFPQLDIIYTNASWAQYVTVLDLMERHQNIHADISWLHVCGAIENLARKFGPERLVFGLGHKSNKGASILDLTEARLEDSAREKIASGNLERLLEIPPSNITPQNTKGELWNSLINQQSSPVEIIDAHGHLGAFPTWMLERQQISDQAEDLMERMDRLNISKMILSGSQALFGDPLAGNRLVEKAAAHYPDRFFGYFVFNPHYHEILTPHFDEFFSREFFVGFKLLSSYWEVPVTDPRYSAAWEYADEHRLPILLHTWDDPYDFPALLTEVVSKYKDAFFILGHSGGSDRGRAAAVELARNNDNVFLEWCGSYQMTLPYEEVFSELGADRIIFGTDAALHSPAWELGRFASLSLPDEVLTPALGANIQRILASRRPVSLKKDNPG